MLGNAYDPLTDNGGGRDEHSIIFLFLASSLIRRLRHVRLVGFAFGVQRVRVGNLFSQEGGIRWKERPRRESLCPVSRRAAAGVVVASHEGAWDGVRSLLYTRRGSDLRDQ